MQPCQITMPEAVALRRHQTATGEPVALPSRLQQIAPQNGAEKPIGRITGPRCAGLPMADRAKADPDQLRHILPALARELPQLAELLRRDDWQAWASSMGPCPCRTCPPRHYANIHAHETIQVHDG